MAETIGGLTILGTTTPFEYSSESPSVSYPYTTDEGPYTILGPVLLPQIYGKDLNAIEVGSSGIIALSIYDKNVLNINSNLNTTNDDGPFNQIVVEAQTDADAIQLRSGATANKIVLDSLLVSESGTQNVISTSKQSLLLNDNVEVSGTLSVSQDAVLSAKLSVQNKVTLGSTLSVGGISTFSSDMFVEGLTMKIPVGTTTDRPVYNEDITVAGSAPTGSIFFNSEFSQFQGLHEDGIWRQFGGVVDSDGNTTIKAELEAGSDENTLYFIVNGSNAATMDENQLSVNLDVIHAQTLSVGDTTVLASNLSVGDFATIASTLSVGGATYINDTFKVQESSIFVGTVTADNAVIMKNTLSVNGVSHFQNNMTVVGNLTAKNPVFMEETLSVNGDTTLNSNLYVTAASTLTGSVTMESTLSVESDVTMSSNLTVADSLSVSGHTTLADYLSVGSFASIVNTLSVGGATTLKNTLSVTEGVSFAKTLNVTGATTLRNTLSVGLDTTIGATLSVGGDLAIKSNQRLRTDKIETTAANTENNMYISLGSGEAGTTYGTLFVEGNLAVMGTVKTTNTAVENVTVMDKKIILSSGADDAGTNSVVLEDKFDTNHKSGIEVEGLPVGINSNNPLYTHPDVGNVYEKSFLWHVSEQDQPNGDTDGLTFTGPLMTLTSENNSTVTNLGSVDKEAFWELKGGQLRISSVFQDTAGKIEKISYSMRITKNKELQFMKHEWKNNETDEFIRMAPVQVATFGVNFR